MPLLRSLGRSLGWSLYQLGTLLAAPAVALARGLAQGRGWRHYLPTLRQRLTLDASAPGSPWTGPVDGADTGRRLWLHAVSVGEVMVAATFARALPCRPPLLVTTVTPTGQERAKALFADWPDARIAYLPLDLRPVVRRFFRRHQPAALLLFEGDYWPLVLDEAARRGLPIGVVNARSSDRAFARQRRLGRVNDLFYRTVERFGVQTPADAERLEALGVDRARIAVTGNLKFDTAPPVEGPEPAATLARLADGRPLLLAGSTMPASTPQETDEETQVLDAFDRLGGGARALLALAPRHPERFDTVARLLAERSVASVRRSEFAKGDPPSRDAAGGGPVDVVLLDSLGELAGLYRHAAAAFVGGTLVDRGGHNPLEPARFGVPVAVGPSMKNFRDIAALFDSGASEPAWARVASAGDLAAVWGRWLDEPAAARAVGARGAERVEAGRGAVERSIEWTAPVLDPVLDPAPDPARETDPGDSP